MEDAIRPVRLLTSTFALSVVNTKIATAHISVILAVVTITAVIREVLEPVDGSKGFILVSVELGSRVLPVLAVHCCLTSTFLKKSCAALFINNAGALDKQFESMGFPVNHGSTRRLTRYLVAFVAIKVLMQQIAFCARGFPDCFDFVLQSVPLLILHVFLSQRIAYLSVLRTHFKTLNTVLRTRDILRSCGILYDSLRSQAEAINELFSHQILLAIPTTFLLMIFNSYQTFRMMKKLTHFDARPIVVDALYFDVFLEIVVPSVLVRGESEQFVNILHKVVNDNEIDCLLLQSYHQKVEFSACAVFSLDGTLLYTVLGALTTYLVILLQFDL